MRFKHLGASALLAFGIAMAATPVVLADEDNVAPPAAICIAPISTFPFSVPGSLLGHPGVVVQGTFQILHEETAPNGLCVGEFLVTIALPGPPTFGGTFTALHLGSTVTVWFASQAATGILFYDSRSGRGWSAAKLTLLGNCAFVLAAFRTTLTGFDARILWSQPLPCS